MAMNLYGQQQNNNTWLYQPIVVELDDSPYYGEGSSSTVSSTSSFVSSNHISAASINISSGVGPANSAPGSNNIIVRGATPLYIPPPPYPPAPSPTDVIGGDCAETTEDQTLNNSNRNHRQRRRKSQSNNYDEYQDYFFEHWRREPLCDDSQLDQSSPRKAFRKIHFRKKGKGRKEEEETIKPSDSEIGASSLSTAETNTSTKMNFHDVYVLTHQVSFPTSNEWSYY